MSLKTNGAKGSKKSRAGDVLVCPIPAPAAGPYIIIEKFNRCHFG